MSSCPARRRLPITCACPWALRTSATATPRRRSCGAGASTSKNEAGGAGWRRPRSPPSAASIGPRRQRVDVFVANSRFTAQRLATNYGRAALVIHPPIDTAAFCPTDERSGRFLVVARLRRYKSLDLAIEAATALGLPLDVIGAGPDRARLQSRAGPTVRFHGRLSDAEVAGAMARCTALIVPGVEDFGMTTAEVQAAGRPRSAFRGGRSAGDRPRRRDGLPRQRAHAPSGRCGDAAGADAELGPRPRSAAWARRFDRAVFDASLLELIQYATEHEVAPSRDVLDRVAWT